MKIKGFPLRYLFALNEKCQCRSFLLPSHCSLPLSPSPLFLILTSLCTAPPCPAPRYVAPENIMAQGYGYSVDWWGLGVLTYVLLTGKQPFSNPKSDDPMVIMRR